MNSSKSGRVVPSAKKNSLAGPPPVPGPPPGETETDAVAEAGAPWVSVTVRRPTNEPALWYVCGMAPGGPPVPAAAAVPSPKSSRQSVRPSLESGAELPDPSNETERGALPEEGATVNEAMGGLVPSAGDSRAS